MKLKKQSVGERGSDASNHQRRDSPGNDPNAFFDEPTEREGQVANKGTPKSILKGRGSDAEYKRASGGFEEPSFGVAAQVKQSTEPSRLRHYSEAPAGSAPQSPKGSQ